MKRFKDMSSEAMGKRFNTPKKRYDYIWPRHIGIYELYDCVKNPAIISDEEHRLFHKANSALVALQNFLTSVNNGGCTLPK